MSRRARISVGLALLLAVGLAAGARAATAGDLALALRFRPLLLFDTRERWRPLDVDAFLAEPGHAACPASGPCAPLTSLAQLTPAIDHLDLRGTRADGRDATAPDLATCAKSEPNLLDCDEGGRSVIYAHVARAGARIAIDYWWFLRYNAWSLDEHEGDWEGVTVIVSRAAPRVLAVDFAAHADVWRYDRGVASFAGPHVRVYVARGDHASYPRRCVFACRQTGGVLPESRFDGRRPWVGSSAAGCRRRCVRLLPAAGGAPASWDAWPGRWGVTLSRVFAPPVAPAFQRRFRHPFGARRSGRHVFI